MSEASHEVNPEDSAPEFFYSTSTPHRWSNGPIVLTLNPDTWEPIKSLKEAKELAERFRVRSSGDDAVDTGYGMRYRLK